MSFANRGLNRSMAVASALALRPGKRCFCRIPSAAPFREVTPRVARALKLAKEAAAFGDYPV
jgi:hypothetical protein